MMKLFGRMKICSWSVVALLLLCSLGAWAQGQPASAAATTTPATPAPAMDVPLDVKAANPPSTEDLAKGDPEGTKTGTVNDLVVSDTKKGLTLADVVNQVSAMRIGNNFTWLLICGFLVMSRQAGSAIGEPGFSRATNANHPMM